MLQMIEVYWPQLAIVVAMVLLVLWFLAARRKTRVEIEPRTQEDRVARRNQALIDAPPATDQTTAAVTSSANNQDVAAAGATADAEAGAEIVQTTGPEPEVAPNVRAAMPEPDPVPSPASPSATAAPAGAADDLSRIKGVGPKLVAQLHNLGVTSFAQVAAWDEAEVDRVDAQLGRFAGRIRRDSWVEQARLLASDDIAAYEGKFGKT